MNRIISLDDRREKQYAARISDLLYFAYESGNEAKISTAASLATKAIQHGVSINEICEAELSVYP